jgi:hypothetical protein
VEFLDNVDGGVLGDSEFERCPVVIGEEVLRIGPDFPCLAPLVEEEPGSWDLVEFFDYEGGAGADHWGEHEAFADAPVGGVLGPS